jgi:maltose O-acetyltransferase
MELTEKQKMLAGALSNDPEIQADQRSAKAWMVRYNAALGATPEERRELLRERLAAVGNGAVIRPPFHCDYGYNISLGADIFLNFNCVILDVVTVSGRDRSWEPRAVAGLTERSCEEAFICRNSPQGVCR